MGLSASDAGRDQSISGPQGTMPKGVAPGARVLWLEHSVANMYLIAAGWLADAEVTLGGYLANLVPVRLGNIVGGAGGVAISYRLANGAA